MISKLKANESFYIIFAIFALGLFMLLSLMTKFAPLTLSHTIYYCQKAFSSILITLPHSLPPLLALVLISIVVIGLISLIIKMSKTYLFIKEVTAFKIKPSSRVVRIARELDVINKIDVVESALFSSFCFGFINPRICISSTLIKNLNDNELKAVLIHESYHLKNKDPLKILLSQIAASMFFFVPTLKDIHSYYILSKEIAADQLVTHSKDTSSLKSALTKMLIGPVPAFSGVAPFVGTGDIEQRIDILTSNKKLSLQISFMRLGLSLLVFVIALAILNMPVYAVENGTDSHSYFICPYGGECAMSCTKEGVIKEVPFGSEGLFTPMNYSVNH